jgi:hypothetical protein
MRKTSGLAGGWGLPPALAILCMALFAAVLSTAAAPRPQDVLQDSAQRIFGGEVSQKDLASAVKHAVWNPDKTAAVVVIKQALNPVIAVFLQRKDGWFFAVDASAVQRENLFRLGVPLHNITKAETEAVKWLPRKDQYLQVIMRTDARINKKKYTISQPLTVSREGKIFWQQ